MKVLVAGAGGFLGHAVARSLASDGADVVGLVRNPAQTERLRSAGATPEIGDLLDPGAVARAARGCEAAVHLAAAPDEPAGEAGRAERVRVEGARVLLRVARSEGLRRLVIGSGYWVYRGGSGELTERSPVEPLGESRINFETERVALTEAGASGPEVLVVRPGMVYGDGSWFRSTLDGIRAGEYRIVGDGANRWSFVARDDVGTGFARILERGAAGEVYNLVDGRPAPWREFIEYVATAVARPTPESVSPESGAARYGREVAHHLAADRAASSAKLEALGWRPRYPSYREGIAELLKTMR